jgi:RNA polymerase sigma-70 factor (family 1)
MSADFQVPDEELINRIRSGDHAAFACVFERYWDVLYLHAFRMLRNEDEAKDVVQDLFSALWLNSSTIHFTSNFAGYLYVALRNRVLNTIRARKSKDKFIDAFTDFYEQQENIISTPLDEKELSKLLEDEIKRLPQKMRVVFELSRNEHLSYKEIAQTLTISDKTVKKQISNALRIIRVNLNKSLGIFLTLL